MTAEDLPLDRFTTACRMLRQAGYLDQALPGRRKGESTIDWMVRHQLAPTPRAAAEMLILGFGLQSALDELTGTEFQPDHDAIDALRRRLAADFLGKRSYP